MHMATVVRSGWQTALLGCAVLFGLAARAEENVYLTEVPDYEWYGACFGTATGNLIGFWDRHGLPNFYTGPTAGGVAPLDSYGVNQGIRSLWMSKAGRDGRPGSQLGHEEDYYVDYERCEDDPYKSHGWPEHAPDCLGDFTGMNQRKWKDLGGECDGNIDGYVYNYWDQSGGRRWNYTPDKAAGGPEVDLQSGLRAFAQYRGYAADTFSQLADFNPDITVPGEGFGYADLKAEIDAGFPVLMFLQNYPEKSRPLLRHGQGQSVDSRDVGHRVPRGRQWQTAGSGPHELVDGRSASSLDQRLVGVVDAVAGSRRDCLPPVAADSEFRAQGRGDHRAMGRPRRRDSRRRLGHHSTRPLVCAREGDHTQPERFLTSDASDDSARNHGVRVLSRDGLFPDQGCDWAVTRESH